MDPTTKQCLSANSIEHKIFALSFDSIGKDKYMILEK